MTVRDAIVAGNPAVGWSWRLARYMLIGFLAIAVFAPFIANDKPVYVREVGGAVSWPLLGGRAISEGYVDSIVKTGGRVIYPLVAFRHQGYTRLASRLQPPGTFSSRHGQSYRHWLGTDRLGRDLAAGLIYGCRKSLGIAVATSVLALLLGGLMGTLAGFWSDAMPIRWSLWRGLAILLGIYLIYLLYYDLIDNGPTMVLALFAVLMAWQAECRWWRGRIVKIPADALIMRLIEVFQSLPALVIIMVIASLRPRAGALWLIVCIAIIRWTSFARFMRAEVIRIKARDYTAASLMSGFSTKQILRYIIWPEAMGPLLVITAFSMSSIVLLESTLAFLGIGVGVDEVTWGTILAQARQLPGAWWLAVFPGVGLFVLVVCLNRVGDGLKRRYDVRD